MKVRIQPSNEMNTNGVPTMCLLASSDTCKIAISDDVDMVVLDLSLYNVYKLRSKLNVWIAKHNSE